MIIDKRSDLQDHLGNNREALIRSGSVFQVTRYYPVALRRLFLAMAELKQVSLCSFGLAKKFDAQYAGSTEISGVNIQPYKYNFSIEREKRKFAFSSEREKICMAKYMEMVQNRTSNHKITKGKKLMNIEIRG
jgi:hypothetical protein